MLGKFAQSDYFEDFHSLRGQSFCIWYKENTDFILKHNVISVELILRS